MLPQSAATDYPPDTALLIPLSAGLLENVFLEGILPRPHLLCLGQSYLMRVIKRRGPPPPLPSPRSTADRRTAYVIAYSY
ncbi:hypothetical protein J6590_012529 [Homalodisca vitripennis]|nr:hypothetical protein J6590_012529 [Homalodisca vitripennis]